MKSQFGKVCVVCASMLLITSGTASALALYGDQGTFLGAAGTLNHEDFDGLPIQPANTMGVTFYDFGPFDASTTGTGVVGINTGPGIDGTYPSPLFQDEWLHYEGGSPGATVTFTFDVAIYEFGIALADAVNQPGSSLSWSYNGDDALNGGLIGTNIPDGTQFFFGIISDTAFTQFTFHHNPSSFDGIAMDNLYYSAPVPEPATMTLMGLGLAGLGFRVRRKSP